MKKLFVDTGAWVAIEDSGDSLHETALSYKDSITAERLLFTSDYILDETFTLFLMNNGYGMVLAFKNHVDLIRRGGLLRVVSITQSLFDEAWLIFERYNRDKQWSFTDCTSFAVMKQLKIDDVFGFDHHFDQMGFRRYPPER